MINLLQIKRFWEYQKYEFLNKKSDESYVLIATNSKQIAEQTFRRTNINTNSKHQTLNLMIRFKIEINAHT